MAGRPRKNNLDFFRHETNMRHDPKIQALRNKFNNEEGCAVYTWVIEYLSEQDNIRCKYSENLSLMAIDFGKTVDRVDEIIQFMVKPLNLVQLQDDILSCESLVKKHADVFTERARDRERKNFPSGFDEYPAGKIENSVGENELPSRVKKSRVEDSRVEKRIVSIKYIVEFLNNTCKTSFKDGSKSTIRHITARLNEGFTLKDFEAVINYKSEQWLQDPKMRQYLRPETLFGTKFESYLIGASRPIEKVGIKLSGRPD